MFLLCFPPWIVFLCAKQRCFFHQLDLFAYFLQTKSGGFKYFLFSPLLGETIKFDEHIFQPLLASLFLDMCSGGTCPKSRRTRLRNS